MANYRLVSNAQFRPFTFEEYVKPYQMYGEAYKEIEQNIIDLEEQAGKWDKLANEQTDPKTHATYKAYADELRTQADQLSRYGMSPQLRRRAATMRGRYAKDIIPIETQYNRRELLREQQHQLQVQNGNSLRFDNDFQNVSLDDMIDNPSMSYNMVSGEKISQEAAAMVLAYANDKGERTDIVDEEGEGKANKWGQKPFLRTETRKGFTLEDAEKAINGDPDADPYLLSIAQKVKDMYKDNPAYDETWAAPYIAKGIRTGVLGKVSTIMGNPNFSSDLQIRGQEETERHNRKAEALQAEQNRLQRIANDRQYQLQLNEQIFKLAQGGMTLDAHGKIREMTPTEKQNSTIYQSTVASSMAKQKAYDISNPTTGFLKIPANDPAWKESGGQARPITKAQYDELLKSGKWRIVCYQSMTGQPGYDGLASHAIPKVTNALKNKGVNPALYYYLVPTEDTYNKKPAYAIAIPPQLMDGSSYMYIPEQ